MTQVWAIVLVHLALVISASAQQPRDHRVLPAAGGAAVAGVVVDAQDGQPLRRAHVTVHGAELGLGRTAITDDEGRFRIEGLPAGRYALTAGKNGHVTMNFGASRPGRPGRTLQLADGTAVRVDVRLPRGSVITGTVMNRDGEPAPGVTVMALASSYEAARGERRYSAAPNGTVATDDRGIYRIFGLTAGTYLVSAVPRLAGRDPRDAQVMDPAEVREALLAVREARTATRPGIPTPTPLPPVPVESRTTVSLAPVYFPGTAVLAGAMPITLHAGEVRNDVNVELDYVPTATIEGLVTVPEGMRVRLTITDADPISPNQSVRASVFPGPDGQFAFRSIPPGSYIILARAFPADVRSMAVPAETTLWGETPVMIAGQDVTGVTIGLERALSISGRLVFEGNAGLSPDLGLVRLPVQAFSASTNIPVTLPSVLIDGSRFALHGVLPGTYRFTSPPRGIRSSIGPWWLKSMIINGKESLDGELQLRESTDSAVVTFSREASELSGTVRDANGAPVVDGHVVVFSSDERFWFHNSRRVAGVRLSGAGSYVVRNLPPGDYLIAITDNVEFNEWFDPEVLRVLAQRAMPVSMRENEVKVLTVSAR